MANLNSGWLVVTETFDPQNWEFSDWRGAAIATFIPSFLTACYVN